MLAIIGGFAIAVGTATGEGFAAILGPVLFATAGIFIPGLATPQAEVPKPQQLAENTRPQPSLNDFEVDTLDVSSNRDATFWEQLTNRYKTNYRRFFEQKKGRIPLSL